MTAADYLETDRLVLTPATGWDTYPLWHLWTDPLVRRYLWDGRVISRGEAAQAIAAITNCRDAGMDLWCVRTAPDAGLIGFAALRDAPWCDGIEPLVGFYPRHWKLGYARETLAAVVEYAFEVVQLDALVAGVDEPNEASHRVALHCGFRRLDVVPGPAFITVRYCLNRIGTQ